jgi:hypothetical protein
MSGVNFRPHVRAFVGLVVKTLSTGIKEKGTSYICASYGAGTISTVCDSYLFKSTILIESLDSS